MSYTDQDNFPTSGHINTLASKWHTHGKVIALQPED